jgi:glycosyltransferase involved in cell wall biosynthesis
MNNITVVIPLFNKANRIAECLKSVTSQTILPDEIIIIDDGSTDASFVVAEQSLANYKGESRIIKQANRGVSSARNRGISLVKTEFVALLDADDEWYPELIDKSIRLRNDFPKGEMYCFSHHYFSPEQGYYKPKLGVDSEFRGYIEDFFKTSLVGSLAHSSKVILRKTAFEKTNGFPDGVVLGEDLVVWMIMAMNGPTVADGYLGTKIHQEPDQSRKGRDGHVPYPLIYFSDFEKQKLLTKNARKYLWKMHMVHIGASLLASNKKEAIMRLKNGQKLFPIANFLIWPAILLPFGFFKILKELRRKKKSLLAIKSSSH